MQDDGDIRNEQESKNFRNDDPRYEALNDPEDLPGPSFDRTEGDEVAGGCQATDPVIDNPKQGIWTQVPPEPFCAELFPQSRCKAACEGETILSRQF